MVLSVLPDLKSLVRAHARPERIQEIHGPALGRPAAPHRCMRGLEGGAKTHRKGRIPRRKNRLKTGLQSWWSKTGLKVPVHGIFPRSIDT